MNMAHTKEGLKITHQTGRIQILTIDDLTRKKARCSKNISETNDNIARIDTHIAEIQKIVNNG